MGVWPPMHDKMEDPAMRSTPSLTLLAIMVLCGLALGQQPQEKRALPEGTLIQEGPVVIEASRPMSNPEGGLGTKKYDPTRRELPFLKKVDEEPVNHWTEIKMPPAVGEKSDPVKEAARKKQLEEDRRKAREYSLTHQIGKYVGWFGVVREISWDTGKKETRLLLENKHYDNLTDLHIQVVSLYGAGDFASVLPSKAPGISHLCLVRIFGKVAKGEDGLPVVTPEYIRVWDWGLFTFMDYGLDKTNPKWLKLRKITDPDNVYSARPTKTYYENLLGKREDAAAPSRADAAKADAPARSSDKP
jgi:hypothetical protein